MMKTSIIDSKLSRGPPTWSQLEHSPCEERLEDQGWFSLEKGQLQRHLTAVPSANRGLSGSGALLSRAQWEGKRQERLGPAVKKPFPGRRGMQWHRLPGGCAGFPPP